MGWAQSGFFRFLVYGYMLINCPRGRKTKIAFWLLPHQLNLFRSDSDSRKQLKHRLHSRVIPCFQLSFLFSFFLKTKCFSPFKSRVMKNWFKRLKKRILDFELSQGAAALKILLRSRTSSCVQDSGAPNDSFLPHSLKTLFRLSRVFLDL